ncbi:MAG: hypothetical protein WKG07_17345 [Hymenobacter sp.]
MRDWLNLLTPSDRRLPELLYLEGYSPSRRPPRSWPYPSAR